MIWLQASFQHQAFSVYTSATPFESVLLRLTWYLTGLEASLDCVEPHWRRPWAIQTSDLANIHTFNKNLSIHMLQQHVRKRPVCIWKRTWADLKRLWTVLNRSEGVLEQAKTMLWLHTSLINRIWAVLTRVWMYAFEDVFELPWNVMGPSWSVLKASLSK